MRGDTYSTERSNFLKRIFAEVFEDRTVEQFRTHSDKIQHTHTRERYIVCVILNKYVSTYRVYSMILNKLKQIGLQFYHTNT